VTIDSPDSRVALRAKLENRQETGSFKARGAWNQLSQLTPAERERGVVACSSGNHGAAVAWAAHRAGVSAVIYMPDDAYANKIEACRALGAKVVLAPTRQEAEEGSRAQAAAGRTLVHPYDAVRTVEGAGTVGLEIAEDWPEVEVVVVPVGGGGLIAGTSLALRRRLGDAVVVLGAEPAGSPSLTLGLEAGEPVPVFENRTRVQGLCPLDSGALAISISQVCVDAVVLLEDDEIFAAQARLVEGGERVEPAGAAAAALVLAGRLPAHLLATRSARDPLRVAVVVSGGNADPEQLLALLRTH
jgi:threonine dehydratase